MVGTMNPPSDREVLIRRAFWLSWLSVGWMSIVAAVAVSAGIAAGSLTLTAFGLDSGIELLSATVLIWRLTVELRQGRHIVEKVEQTASRISRNLLFALAAYIIRRCFMEPVDATRRDVFSIGSPCGDPCYADYVS